MIYRAAEVARTSCAGAGLREERDPKAFDQLLYRDVRNKNVTAEFEPKDTILWDLQVENLVAKRKVRKYYTLREV